MCADALLRAIEQHRSWYEQILSLRVKNIESSGILLSDVSPSEMLQTASNFAQHYLMAIMFDRDTRDALNVPSLEGPASSRMRTTQNSETSGQTKACQLLNTGEITLKIHRGTAGGIIFLSMPPELHFIHFPWSSGASCAAAVEEST